MNQKGFAPILILFGILVIVAAAGGVYYLGRSSAKLPDTSPISVPTSQTSVSPTQPPAKTYISPSPTTINETANWKTYTNEKYKISFKYPPRLSPCLGS